MKEDYPLWAIRSWQSVLLYYGVAHMGVYAAKRWYLFLRRRNKPSKQIIWFLIIATIGLFFSAYIITIVHVKKTWSWFLFCDVLWTFSFGFLLWLLFGDKLGAKGGNP
jgi:hypothetical protein